jgi:hypothetical protein
MALLMMIEFSAVDSEKSIMFLKSPKRACDEKLENKKALLE